MAAEKADDASAYAEKNQTVAHQANQTDGIHKEPAEPPEGTAALKVPKPRLENFDRDETGDESDEDAE